METPIAFYQQCIKQILSEYESLKTPDSEIELIFDDERMRYLAIWVGWQQQKRIHQCALHIDICEGNILIQWNDTEELIDETLIEMGVPKDAIRLAMIPPDFRVAPEEPAAYQAWHLEKKAA